MDTEGDDERVGIKLVDGEALGCRLGSFDSEGSDEGCDEGCSLGMLLADGI